MKSKFLKRMDIARTIDRFNLFGRPFAAVVLFISMVGCTEIVTSKSEYNLGVDAYQSKKYSEAREHWAKAADDGEIFAQNNLGYLMYNGLGGESNPERAVHLWHQAAAGGNSEAQWHLGAAYESGKGASKDQAAAYAWYRCAIVSSLSAQAREDSGAESEINRLAAKSLSDLLEKFPADQLQDAEALAKQYISNYSK